MRGGKIENACPSKNSGAGMLHVSFLKRPAVPPGFKAQKPRFLHYSRNGAIRLSLAGGKNSRPGSADAPRRYANLWQGSPAPLQALSAHGARSLLAANSFAEACASLSTHLYKIVACIIAPGNGFVKTGNAGNKNFFRIIFPFWKRIAPSTLTKPLSPRYNIP